jgi:Kdo2-lipid IVA lauroyltransferase/acyltransferase
MPLFQRIIEKVLVFILRDVASYRFNVIRNNLKSTFEYKNDRQLRSDIQGNYRFLARVLRQEIGSATRKILGKKLYLKPFDQFDLWLSEGKSVIVTMGHVGNWEWTGLYLGMRYPGKVCALYKRIKSRWLNDFMIKRRTSMDGHLVESGKIGDLIKLMNKQPVLILMIADQNPGNDRGIIWVDFLGRKTAFVSGPETLAVKYNLPVVYLNNYSQDDGSYLLEAKLIYDGETSLPNGEITRRYAKALEDNIRQQPTEWLWSHKRWKRSPEIDNVSDH